MIVVTTLKKNRLLNTTRKNRKQQHPVDKKQSNNDKGDRGKIVITASRGKSTRNKGNEMKENGNIGEEQFRKVDVEVYRRQIPKISISFRMEDETNHHHQRQQQRHTPILVDYQELSQVSEAFVHQFFRTILEEEEVPVRFVHEKGGVHVFLSVNEDTPCVVDVVVTLAFVIPGHVPTVQFLSDRLQEGLLQVQQQQQQLGSNDDDGERDPAPASTSTTRGAFFVTNLQTAMSHTNPFSKTVSIDVVRHSSDSSLPVTPPSVISSANSDTEVTAGATSGSTRRRRFISMMTTTERGLHIVISSFLTGMGCVIPIVTTMRFLSENKKTRHYPHEDDTTSITTATTTATATADTDTTTTTTTTTTRTILSNNEDHCTTDQTISSALTLTLMLAFDDDELN